jgi:hypothetical protein
VGRGIITIPLFYGWTGETWALVFRVVSLFFFEMLPELGIVYILHMRAEDETKVTSITFGSVTIS